jgi:hypothetical protein
MHFTQHDSLLFLSLCPCIQEAIILKICCPQRAHHDIHVAEVALNMCRDASRSHLFGRSILS